MAKILATVPLTAPASSGSYAVDATFTMSENYTLSGSGASPTVTLYWQYDQGTGTWVDIPTTGTTGLVANSGSQAIAAEGTTYSRTITCKSTGSYVIRARGISSTPTTVDSANQPTTTIAAMPAAPSNAHTISKTDVQIAMGWTGNSNNETGFKMYKNDVYIETITADLVSYTFTGLTAGTQYDLAVKATNNGIDSAESQLTETTTVAAPPFVAIAYNSAVAASSPDGITWTKRSMPASRYWYFVAYGNGMFVAVVYGSAVAASSPDGITWTERTIPTAAWCSVAYGNGMFVAFAFNTNRYATSPDGITWTEGALPFNKKWNSVTYGNGMFVAVAYDAGPIVAFAVSSPDGITWTERTIPAQAYWISVAHGNGVFVAVAYDSWAAFAVSSPDGITWTERAISARAWSSVTYGNGMFVAVAYGGAVAASSPDGIAWTQRTLPFSANWLSVTYGNGMFVALTAGAKSASSPDGITWTERTMPENVGWRSVAYGGASPTTHDIETIAYLFTPPDTYDENPDTIDFAPSENPITVDAGADQIIAFELGTGYPPASYYIKGAWITNVETSEREQVLPLPVGTYTFVDVQHDWIFEVDVAHTFCTVKSFPWVGKFRMCKVP